MKKIIISMVITTIMLLIAGCDTVKLYSHKQEYASGQSQQQSNENLSKMYNDKSLGGTYLRDEGVLGFLWYVPLNKSVSGNFEIQAYRFAQENVVLFLMTILLLYVIRFKKQKNIYQSKLNSIGVPPLMEIGKSSIQQFRRAKLLFIALSIVTLLVFTTVVLYTNHIVIHDIAIYKIVVGLLLISIYICLYWHYIMLYTNIYVTKNNHTDDLSIISDMTLIWVVLLSVILSWFGVIGLLSGMFLPVFTIFFAVTIILILKERTGLSGSFLDYRHFLFII